jgi:hypothetical protein
MITEKYSRLLNNQQIKHLNNLAYDDKHLMDTFKFFKTGYNGIASYTKYRHDYPIFTEIYKALGLIED